MRADVAKSLEAMKTSFKLLKTENILLLSVFTAYSGILLGFWSGVYGTALSRTEGFEDPKSMPGSFFEILPHKIKLLVVTLTFKFQVSMG